MRPFETVDGAATTPRHPSDLPPYLEQGRAQTSLRRELATLLSEIESRMDVAGDDEDALVELSTYPNRIIARRGESATSFSWLSGRLGGISDGYLLVIEWSGLPSDRRGAPALASATSRREKSYRAEAANAESWGWRAGDARACSTSDLVQHWLDAGQPAAPAAG